MRAGRSRTRQLHRHSPSTPIALCTSESRRVGDRLGPKLTMTAARRAPNSGDRAAGFGEGAPVVGSANPDAPLKGLEADAKRLDAPHGLRSAGDLTVGEVRLNQIDQR